MLKWFSMKGVLSNRFKMKLKLCSYWQYGFLIYVILKFPFNFFCMFNNGRGLIIFSATKTKNTFDKSVIIPFNFIEKKGYVIQYIKSNLSINFFEIVLLSFM